MQWSMQIINMHDSESIYPRQFLTIFLFSLSRHLWWYLLFLHTFFFFSSPREIARSGHTTERWKCVLSICTAYVASDATRTRCHVDAHLSVKASCALCPFKRTFVALVANISLFFSTNGRCGHGIAPSGIPAECCARVMLTRALRIEALARPSFSTR